MELSSFKQSIKEENFPTGINIYLQAMWYDGVGNWAKAHNCVDHLEDTTACWVHAYLHRKEGDTWNADYWYRRAGKKRPAVSLAAEWEEIVNALISGS